MNGVEILSSAQVACEYAFNWEAFWIAFCVVFCVVVLIFANPVITGEIERWFILIGLFIGVVAGGLMGLVVGDILNTPTAYETHYKVTIDDSVSMTEFLDKYEILDQEGKIYTVKERE